MHGATVHAVVEWILKCCALFFVCISASAIAKPPSILLANLLGPHVDVTQYLVSEKYDGVRAIWDGKTLRFRSGREVAAPVWFINQLPSTPLDGELWLARRKFDELSGIVRKTAPNDAEWVDVKYMVFELPDAPGTFEHRYEKIREIVAAAKMPQLHAVEQTRVVSRAELCCSLDRSVDRPSRQHLSADGVARDDLGIEIGEPDEATRVGVGRCLG